MFHWLRTLWQALCGALRHSGGAHYVTGGPGLPPPLTPEQEKALLAEMAAGSAAARNAPCGPIRPSASSLWYIAVFVLQSRKRRPAASIFITATSAAPSAANCAQDDANCAPSAVSSAISCALTTPRALSFSTCV